jgi:hypothetical protein
MAKKFKHRKYSGELNKPLEIDHDKWALWEHQAKGDPVKTMETDSRIEAEMTIKWQAKMRLLFDEFGIPKNAPDRWEQLAGALAYAHVPGFSSNERGAPKKWHMFASATFVFAVERTRLNKAIGKNRPQISTIDAIKTLIKKDPRWGKNATSLHKRYNEAVRKGAPLFASAGLAFRKGMGLSPLDPLEALMSYNPPRLPAPSRKKATEKE